MGIESSGYSATVVQSERLFPAAKPPEKAVPLSLLDATTCNFSSTTALWLFERPQKSTNDKFDLYDYFRQSLPITLNDYPQLSGLLRSITTLESSELEKETIGFPTHARRFGRVYAHYGSLRDPGVEFVTATTTATIETLCPASRTRENPLLDRHKVSLDTFLPQGRLASATNSLRPDSTGLLPSACVIQLTRTACGGFVLGVEMAHPLADIQSLVYFVKDWAKISRWRLEGSVTPKPILEPDFNPGRLDAMAAGDINAHTAVPDLLKQIKSLPFHRYDWWAEPSQCPWTQDIPEPFRGQDLPPTGKSMPWSEWDVASPVSHYTVHLTRDQIEKIWNKVPVGGPGSRRISRHDAILAHIWSCITRARNLEKDHGLVHCNLAFGTRPALKLGDDFFGSPVVNINIEMPAHELVSPQIPEGERARSSTQCIRNTISRMGQPGALEAHLYSLAFEKTPQRIWQAFLGSRHIIVTSWARVGIYDLNFGLNTPIRYAEGKIPDLDGVLLIKDGPPSNTPKNSSERTSWTDNGVDVSIHLRAEDLDRLIRDPLLLP